MLKEAGRPTSPPIFFTVLGYAFSVQPAMAPKTLIEEVKLLNKVKEEKEKNQSLTTKQLVALVGVS